MNFAVIRLNGVPLEAWVTLPLVVVSLYVLFRWRKFGEDSFTWNHSYLKRAVVYGVGVWGLSLVIPLLPEPWQRIAAWVALAAIATVALDYWGGEGLASALKAALLMAAIGFLAMPLPAYIGRFVYGEQTPTILKELRREGKARTFHLALPPSWEELAGSSPRGYRSSRPGAGILQISLQPPLNGPVDAERARRELDTLLVKLDADLGVGKRLTLTTTPGVFGPIAKATTQSEQHGLLAFWLLPGEVTIFATYTDGSSRAAEADITEADAALRTVRLE